MFYICKLTESGKWQGLRSTTDEEYAERIVDFYCDKWPNAYIDILSYEEYHGGTNKWQQMAITESANK